MDIDKSCSIPELHDGEKNSQSELSNSWQGSQNHKILPQTIREISKNFQSSDSNEDSNNSENGIKGV